MTPTGRSAMGPVRRGCPSLELRAPSYLAISSAIAIPIASANSEPPTPGRIASRTSSSQDRSSARTQYRSGNQSHRNGPCRQFSTGRSKTPWLKMQSALVTGPPPRVAVETPGAREALPVDTAVDLRSLRRRRLELIAACDEAGDAHPAAPVPPQPGNIQRQPGQVYRTLQG